LSERSERNGHRAPEAELGRDKDYINYEKIYYNEYK